jgi:hypothetical protein
MEGAMLDTPSNRAGWQTVNRRVVDFQRKIRVGNALTAIYEYEHDVDQDADRPFGRAEVRLKVQKWWWQF